uniref:Uncharacterized protein LOC100184132 n=1 Tax=Phallusia mammillata TaxID=59560 RepID=A0A6F9DIN2_9ASCI|nr:uncharacterized protein LOC100184132 [Phallusia mammillata]
MELFVRCGKQDKEMAEAKLFFDANKNRTDVYCCIPIKNGSNMETNSYEMQYKNNFVKNKDFNLNVFCPDDDSSPDSDEYRQVFSSAESYLNRNATPQIEKSSYHSLKNFKKIVQRNKEANIQTTWGRLASVFFLLHWYSLRIIRAPWRKSYTKVKIYSGSYHHAIGQNLPKDVADELMGKLGFIYHRPRQTFFFHQESLLKPGTGTWQDALLNAGMDYFLVHVRCALGSSQMGRSIEIDILSLPSTLPRTKTNEPENKNRISRFENWNTLNKKQHMGAFQPYGNTPQVNSAPAMPTDRNTDENFSLRSRCMNSEPRLNRVEKEPTNFYLNTAYRPSSRPPSNKGELQQSNIPYSHRILTPPKQQEPLRRPPRQYVPQYSEEDLYEGKDPSDISLEDGAIKYPPIGPFVTSRFGMETLRRIKQEPLVRGIQSVSVSNQLRDPPDRDYVRVMPINRAHKTETFSGTEPLSNAGISTGPSYFNTSPLSQTDVAGSSTGGAYVQVQPPKRGEDSHIYQEISDDHWPPRR